MTVSTLENCSYGYSSGLCMTKETLCTDIRYKMCNGEDYKFINKAPTTSGPKFPIGLMPASTVIMPISIDIIPTTTVVMSSSAEMLSTSTVIMSAPTPSSEIQCLAELIGYSCCSPEFTDVYSHDDYGDWSYNFQTNEWCGLTPYQETTTEDCWSESLGYSCCKGCHVVEVDKDGSWGYEKHHWCGIPSTC